MAAEAVVDETRVRVDVCSQTEMIRKLLHGYDKQEPPVSGLSLLLCSIYSVIRT